MTPDAATAHASSVLLWAEVTLLWSAVNYLFAADPMRESVDGIAVSPPVLRRWVVQVMGRSIVAGLLTDVLGNRSVRVELGVFIFVLCLALPLVRIRLRPSMIGEWELLANAVWFAGGGAIIFYEGLGARFSTAWPAGKVAAGCFIVALFLFMLRGGTFIVRGFLDKCGALPPLLSSQPQVRSELHIDFTEFNRGRLIGNLERILIAAMVAGGDYSALGFLVAAKGLIRSKDLENRDWAEYFLVGTLASVLVAVLVGLCVKAAIRLLW